MATWEDARRCPKCNAPGKEISSIPATREDGSRASMKTLQCEMVLCRWYGENFLVQVNADGSIPDPESPLMRHANKQYRVDEGPGVIAERIAKMNAAGDEINNESLRQGRLR